MQFSTHNIISKAVGSEAYDVYEHMRSGQHPNWKGKRTCALTVLVFKPINKDQSKELNNQKAKNANYLGAGAAGISTLVTRSKTAGFVSGALARKYALDKLRSWDEGDILVRFDARVSGGVGPQGHMRVLVIKRSVYDPNTVNP